MLERISKAQPRTLYVRRDVVNATDIIRWAKAQGFPTTLPASELHVTIAFSKKPVDWIAMGSPSYLGSAGEDAGNIVIGAGGPRVVEELGGKAVTLLFASSALSYRNQEIRDLGASWDWPSYQPHITITYQPGDVDLSQVEPYQGEIVLGPEIFSEIVDDWHDDILEKVNQMEKVGARHSKSDQTMLQNIHDHAVSLGAQCDGDGDSDMSKRDDIEVKLIKVDQSLGLVFGWAIICKRDGMDYYDLNRDGSGERVPEHIPEESMLSSAADFMQKSRVAKEMHSGDGQGQVVFAFPLTSDIAKAMGISTRVTGLMIAMKPDPAMLAKFVSGELTGFSIGGRKVEFEEVTGFAKSIPADASVKEYIDDFIASDNKRFEGKSKEKRIQMALGAWYAANG